MIIKIALKVANRDLKETNIKITCKSVQKSKNKVRMKLQSNRTAAVIKLHRISMITKRTLRNDKNSNFVSLNIAHYIFSSLKSPYRREDATMHG